MHDRVELTSVDQGIYIEGWGGVRFEDSVLVTHEGDQVLSHAAKVAREGVRL